LRLEVASTDLKPGRPVVISIRPHQIAMSPAERPAAGAAQDNALTGIVRRASYLGDTVDYQVEIEDGGIVLRVAGPAPALVRSGHRVRLNIPPATCIPLPESTSD